MADSKSNDVMVPLLGEAQPRRSGAAKKHKRSALHTFLEGETPAGKIYEAFTIFLIVVNVITFIVGTLFDKQYNPDGPDCSNTCDALFFGLSDSNGLLGTSVVEIITTFVFTLDYACRFYTAGEVPQYQGLTGRVRFVFTFFALVDLVSVLPFYVDFAVIGNVPALQFLRMFRLLRMMKVEGRYVEAFTLFDDVIREQQGVLGTAMFVGMSTWIICSALYYVAEHRSTSAIYCGASPECGNDVDTDLCTFDEYGFVNCTAAGCPGTAEKPYPCWNLFQSIPGAAFFTLLNLFGEFPLIDDHSAWGKVIATFVAVIAVAVFAIPAGILGNGFEDLLAERRAKRKAQERLDRVAQATTALQVAVSAGWVSSAASKRSDSQLDLQQENPSKRPVHGDARELQGRVFNFVNGRTKKGRYFETLVNALIVVSTLLYMVETTDVLSSDGRLVVEAIELFAVIVFTVEYGLRLYAAGQDPKFAGCNGRVAFALTFFSLVDLLSIAPYWIQLVADVGANRDPFSDQSVSSTFVRCLRLLRILRAEKYMKAFTVFDDVLRDSSDVLAVTGFCALVMWVFFSALMYFAERSNPDLSMQEYYKSVPDAMWGTLLNLSGESPLCHFTGAGKVIAGVVGVFATGFFGIPIGILGAGFEEWIEEHQEDTPDRDGGSDEAGTDDSCGEQKQTDSTSVAVNSAAGPVDWHNFSSRREAALAHLNLRPEPKTSLHVLFDFTNGVWPAGFFFDVAVFLFIFLTVTLGIIETVDGYTCDDNSDSTTVCAWFSSLEWVAVLFFTAEYVMRLIAAPADPAYAGTGYSPFVSRFMFVFSFYSLVDILAIVPFYIAEASPGSWVDSNDGYFRMLRILRLFKLDKYVPSITLIDDVFRLKRHALAVTSFAAGALWIFCSALLYIAEKDDYTNDVDPLPLTGCNASCHMANRFDNIFDSMEFTCIHLTGDYPIISYTLWARIICFFMVILAVGVVSIPSGLIASGFAQVVQSKSKKRSGEDPAGDGYFERQREKLQDQPAPKSCCGNGIDALQVSVNRFLNGTTAVEINASGEEETVTKRGTFSGLFSLAIFLLIVLNVFAVLAETIPEMDRQVGNEPGNFFDVFETISVLIFTAEYLMRLFSASKDLDHLYSPWFYATTFFGFVDLLAIAPWYIEQIMVANGSLQLGSDSATIFRVFRIFRILQLEHFVTAFTVLDNVFRASADALKATGVMAMIIWIGCGALFYIFEKDNPNWRRCSDKVVGCYDFASTDACNKAYPGECEQIAFVNMPDALYYTAVFLGGEWGKVDFTWPGKLVCIFLCVAGIALYAIPIGTLFDSFGAVLGMAEEDDGDEEADNDNDNGDSKED